MKKLKSIFTTNMNRCIISGYEDPEGTPMPKVERHHVFGGFNRQRSEKYDYIAPLLNIYHPNGVLADDHWQELDTKLKQVCQRHYEKHHGSREDFIAEFGRSYLQKMKVLSLFDGISCGMVALDRAGIPVERYVAYEIDKYAIKISQKNYPQIEQCGDVTMADFTQYQGFDLLIGGSPCQSLSIVQSKTRQHLDGKSKLFFEFVRAMEEVKPKYFLFENVASMNEESKQAISELLGCEPIFIDSGDFSAQERPRYYWTNIPVQLNYEKSKDILADALEPEVESKYFYDHPLVNVDMSKQVCATMEFKNHDMHKRIFNPAFKVHTLTTCGGGNTQKKVYINGKARKLTPLEYERLQTLPDNYTAGVANGHRYNALGNGWTVDVIAHIFRGLT